MNLIIDGNTVIPKTGESLRQMICRLGLDSELLSTRPLAAKIAGEVFNLNYIPVREKDVTDERTSIRRAMAASNGVIRLLRYEDPEGKEVYVRTAQFMLFLALHRLYPGVKAKMNCTVGSALFVEIVGVENFSAFAVKKEIQRLMAGSTPFIRKRVTGPYPHHLPSNNV